jgi:Flp pilus assembly pilin Flp
MSGSKKNNRNPQQGQGLVEYALIIVMVALAILTIISLIGPAVGNVFSNILFQVQYGPEGDAGGVGWLIDDDSSYFAPADGTCDYDGNCEASESVDTCPADCKEIVLTCGNGVCGSDETVASCPADCPESCNNDGKCTGAENASNCAGDCIVTCGNGVCGTDEDESSCPADCGCDNDGYCEADRDETEATCSNDCGCDDDGSCEPNRGEDADNCPSDCADSTVDCDQITIGAPYFYADSGSTKDEVAAEITNNLSSPIYVNRVIVSWQNVSPNSTYPNTVYQDGISLGTNHSYPIWGDYDDDPPYPDEVTPTDTAGAEAGDWNTSTNPIINASSSRLIHADFDGSESNPNFQVQGYDIDQFDYTVYFTNGCAVTTGDTDPEPPEEPDCGLYTISPIYYDDVHPTYAQVLADITNNDSVGVDVSRIIFNWPKIATNTNADYISLKGDSNKIWGVDGGGEDHTAPTDTGGDDSSEWLYNSNNTVIAAGTTAELRGDLDDQGNPDDIRYTTDLSEFQFTVHLSNGCILQTHNPVPDTYIYLEEADFSRTGSWADMSDGLASGCYYVRGTGAEGNYSGVDSDTPKLSSTFTVGNDGLYRIWIKTRSRADYCDQLFYAVDGETPQTAYLSSWSSWTWNSVDYTLSAGAHTLEIWAGDGGGSNCDFGGVNGGADIDLAFITNDTKLDPDDEDIGQVCNDAVPFVLEAEDTDYVTYSGPITVEEDADASQCEYIQVPEVGGDYDGIATADFTININLEGDYNVWAYAWGLNGNADSWWVSVDGGFEETLGVPDPPENRDWLEVDTWHFTPGEHTISFRVREDGSSLDAIAVAYDGLDYNPEDDFEVVCSDDIPEEPTADELVCGGDPVTGIINNVNYEDEWQFIGTANTLVTVTMRRASGNLDSYLQLLGPDGTVIVEDDDHGKIDGDSSTNQDAEFAFVLPSNGVYTVLATRYAYNQTAGERYDASGNPATIGQYNLWMECTPLSASPVSCGEIIGDGDPAGDIAEISEDAWFNVWEFGGTAGTTLSLRMNRASNNLQPQIILHDPDGIEVARDDGDSRAEIIDYELAESGLYTITATRRNMATGDTTGQYTLEISCGGTQTISCGDTVEGRLSSFHTEDFWEFDAEAGNLISFVTEPVDGSLDSIIYIYDSQTAIDNDDRVDWCGSGSSDCADNDHGPDTGSMLIMQVRDTGTYWLKAYKQWDNDGGDYRLTMMCHEPTTIQCGETVTGSITETDFLDRYTFDNPNASSVGRVYISMEKTNGDLAPKIYLWRPDYSTRDRRPRWDGEAVEIYENNGEPLDRDGGTWEIWASRYTDHSSDWNDFYPADDPTTTGEYSMTFLCNWDWREEDCIDLVIDSTEIYDSDTARALITNDSPYFQAYVSRAVFDWPDMGSTIYNDYIYLQDRGYLWGYDNSSSSRDYTSPTDTDTDSPYLYSTSRYLNYNGDAKYIYNDFDATSGSPDITTYTTDDFSYQVTFTNGCTIDNASAVCSDGQCTGDENASNCPADCPSECGDGYCTSGEDSASCGIDCASCGDGICAFTEAEDGTCPSDCETVRIEAEDGTLTSPMISNGDMDASACYYTYTPDGVGNDGKVTFDFNVTNAGDYTLWGRIYAPDSSGNSFHVSMDGAAEEQWLLPTGVVQWEQFKLSGEPVTFNLAAGSHTLEIRTSEDGTIIDLIEITNYPNHDTYTPAAITTCTDPPPVEVRINVNSSGFVGADGEIWQASAGFANGNAASVSNTISNTETVYIPMYQTYLWYNGDLQWSWPAGNGDYAVRLHFSENYPSGNYRTFDINIEGTDVLTDFNPYGAAGDQEYTAVIRAFSNITVSDGEINIHLNQIAGMENPAIMGIEVIPCEDATCAVCGDGVCNGSESTISCPLDC